MPVECLLDTNILIYAAAGKRDEPSKHTIARRLVLETDFGLSGQVLAEFAVNVATKVAVKLPSGQIDEWLELLSGYPVAPVDADLVRRGVALARRFGINYFDAAIIAAAECLGAPILYTEDLNDGQAYGPVRVVNPFRSNE